MNIKSLLLGSAAALLAVTGARAADAVTVVAEPEPMEYVRVCDVYGTGFFYIPGTETCLRVSGYLRYDIGVGELWGADLDGLDEDGGDTYYKRARFALRVDARSETELGTLRGYAQINFNVDLNSEGGGGGFVDKGASINHAYIELGGFRIGKTDSYYTTWTGYAGPVIHDGQIGYGPFDTHQIAYTFDAGNGFSVGGALEGGSGGFELDDYMPHVVLGAKYTAAWGAIAAVGGYDANSEEFAGKLRVDVNATEQLSLFIMGGWDSEGDDPANGIGTGFRNFYAPWGGDWAIWGGGSFKVSEKASIGLEVDYDDFENFGVALNVAYELVPGLTITPEVGYFDNLDDDLPGEDDDGAFGGFVRFQRDF